MNDMLRSLPDAALIVLFGAVAFALVAVTGVLARSAGLTSSTERSAGALDAYKIIVSFTAVVLGFSLVQAQGTLRSTDQAVSREAGAINQLDRVLLRYGPETRTEIRGLLHGYVEAVIREDWPAMQRGRQSDAATEALARLNRAVQTLNSGTAARPQLYAEMLKQLDSLNDSRQEREDAASSGVSQSLWEALLCLFGIMLSLSLLIRVPNRLVALGGHAVAIGILFSLVFVMDQPFKGQTSIKPTAIVRVLAAIDTRRE